MPDLVPKILTGVMGEFWDDVPGRDVPGARAGDGPFAAIRPVSGPVLSAMPRKTSTGGPAARSRHSWCSLQALAVLRGLGRGRLWQCSTIRRKPSSRRAPRDDLPHARPSYESPAHISALEASSILRKNWEYSDNGLQIICCGCSLCERFPRHGPSGIWTTADPLRCLYAKSQWYVAHNPPSHHKRGNHGSWRIAKARR